MKATTQTMDFRVALPSQPEVQAWFMTDWSFAASARGIKPGHYVIPDWEKVNGLVVVVEDERADCIGMVLFEEINATDVIVHTALRTFGHRTDHAFTTAVHMARRHGYNQFYFAFSVLNRPVHQLAERLGLLENCALLQPDWATAQFIFGGFTSCPSLHH